MLPFPSYEFLFTIMHEFAEFAVIEPVDDAVKFDAVNAVCGDFTDMLQAVTAEESVAPVIEGPV